MNNVRILLSKLVAVIVMYLENCSVASAQRERGQIKG